MIVIIGGGIIGLTMAKLLAKENFQVTIVESHFPELYWQDLTARVSAIHLKSMQLFEYLNIPIPAQSKSPLIKMHIWDYAGSEINFDSNAINKPEMGFIIENRAMIKSLWQSLELEKNVTILCPAQAKKIIIQDNKIQLILNDHKSIEADLIIGADGAHSWVRNQMPVKLIERAYNQKAIITVMQSEKPHHHTAYQKFLTSGPIALLPLDEKNLSALVWSADHSISDTFFLALENIFNQTVSENFDYKLGALQAVAPRQQFELIMRHVDHYVSEKIALIGDAAHTIHPLAGQGVNLGLMDAACLTQVLTDARAQKKIIGDLRVLRKYARWRRADNAVMIFTMKHLKDIFSDHSVMFSYFRGFSVNAIDRCSVMKNYIMKIAMGESRDLPKFLEN
ncbi:MAG: hypothetical protein A3E82_02665 [Gammaproteobacteria bacterium RIFCSPHIGHO2_12_FULL_38_11]|nr:MAG: hypothetical protein A3E82_02665 [Gammaproteobacteria bacterium RIFCSPHIGHO2_12_FULL_38_11]